MTTAGSSASSAAIRRGSPSASERECSHRCPADAGDRRGTCGSPLRVAIAGLGPKGLFALERLLDHARSLESAMRMQIDVFEPHPVPGAGPIYDPAQPEYLRMNFAAGQIDMWWPEEPGRAACRAAGIPRLESAT